jgi:hypothetical protein
MYILVVYTQIYNVKMEHVCLFHAKASTGGLTSASAGASGDLAAFGSGG